MLGEPRQPGTDNVAALPQDNSHTLRGALVQGSTTGFDSWADTRTRNESRVALEYNAGYTSALAAFEELTSPTWPQCLQGFGYFSTVRTGHRVHPWLSMACKCCSCNQWVCLSDGSSSLLVVS
jgi:hypothetical protein